MIRQELTHRTTGRPRDGRSKARSLAGPATLTPRARTRGSFARRYYSYGPKAGAKTEPDVRKNKVHCRKCWFEHLSTASTAQYMASDACACSCHGHHHSGDDDQTQQHTHTVRLRTTQRHSQVRWTGSPAPGSPAPGSASARRGSAWARRREADAEPKPPHTPNHAFGTTLPKPLPHSETDSDDAAMSDYADSDAAGDAGGGSRRSSNSSRRSSAVKGPAARRASSRRGSLALGQTARRATRIETAEETRAKVDRVCNKFMEQLRAPPTEQARYGPPSYTV